MTNGEKKKILMSYRRLAQQDKAIIEQIDELTLLHSPNLDGMPHGAADPRGLDAFWVKAGALFEKWQALLDKKYAALSVITDALEQMPNETEKTLLMLRYIKGMTFEQVAVEMGYSWRHTLRLHGQALAHFMEGGEDDEGGKTGDTDLRGADSDGRDGGPLPEDPRDVDGRPSA